MNSEIMMLPEQPQTAGMVIAQVRRIQEIFESVMKDGTHYGKIPGTPKPSLWKPGAEKIAATFHIALDPTVEDISTPDIIRYRIKVRATSQASGMFLGAGMGECSTDEEKFKWKKAVCREEFDATPEDRRRKKWIVTDSGPKELLQIRTNPYDLANTVLKMADKRAFVAAILRVTGASDIFDQDIEDLPDDLKEDVKTPKPPPAAPKEKTKPMGEAPKTDAAKTEAPKDAPKQEQAPPPPTDGGRQAEPSAPAEEVEYGGEDWEGVIKYVDETSGEKKSGEKWTLYIVKGEDKSSYSTFSKSLAEKANALKKSKVVAVLTWDQDGKYKTLKSVESLDEANARVAAGESREPGSEG